MSHRLAPFSIAELYAIVFSLDIAGTFQRPAPEAHQIRQESIDELKEKRRNFNDSGCGQRCASNHHTTGPLATA
jgi:hypothetical protein